MSWKQFEDQWELDRMGSLTSSKISCLLVIPNRDMTKDELDARPKVLNDKGNLVLAEKGNKVPDHNSLGAGAITYCKSLVTELLTGGTVEVNVYAMRWGNEQEPHAIEALRTLYPDIIHYGREFFPLTEWSGGSPDAVNVAEGFVRVFEIKCPESPDVHMDYCDIENQGQLKEMHPDHYAQLQMNMMCVAKHRMIPFGDMCGTFVSFHPYLKGAIDCSLFTLNVRPDIEMADLILERIELATAEMRKIKNKRLAQFKKR